MRSQLEQYPVSTVIILGIAGGNGLEYISTEKYRKVYAIDINEDYLETVRERYAMLNHCLKCLQVDLLSNPLHLPQAELLIANLLIEYIGYEAFQRVVHVVQPTHISCVIQLNTDDTKWVSDSPYLHTFDQLDQVHHQVEEQALCNTMEAIHYKINLRTEIRLPNGKKLVRLDFLLI